MGEEQGLSAENRALVERFYKEHAPEAVSALGTAPFNRLNALLDAARAEGLQPPVVEIRGEDLGPLGASKAPSCASAGVAETPSGGWRDIASAPKDGTPIDIWAHDERLGIPGRRFAGVRWGRHDEDTEAPFGAYHWRGAYEGDGFIVTHWRPLPAPPTDCQTSGGEA